MLNFRKLKRDCSPAILKEGKELFDNGMVLSAKIVNLSSDRIRLGCRVKGNFDNTYDCEIEINRQESVAIDSDCDCAYKYDCQHLSAFVFYLETHLDQLIVDYSKQTNLDDVNAKDKAKLKKTFKEAATKEKAQQNKKCEKELIEEYIGASNALGQSPFFLPEVETAQDQAELMVICTKLDVNPEIQLALRLPFRSKPLNVPNAREFLDAVRYGEMIYIANRRFLFSLASFDHQSSQILKLVLDCARFADYSDEGSQRTAFVDVEAMGAILASSYEMAVKTDLEALPCLYRGSLEEPLQFSNFEALFRIELEYLEAPTAKLLLKPTIVLEERVVTILEEANLFECAAPGVIHNNTYYRFQPIIRRKHLRNLKALRDITIPEALFGTFVENSLPELKRFSEVANLEVIESFTTLPFTGKLKAVCDISYLDGELEASLHFVYDKLQVPSAASKITAAEIQDFIMKQGILARNLTEEQKIIEDLFQDFVYDPLHGIYQLKTEKKIVEFMTEVIPRNQDRVTFNCPENLLDQFIYDDTRFVLNLKETKHIDAYEVDLKVNGHLNGVTVDLLWECLASRRSFIELAQKKVANKKDKNAPKIYKILVLDLEKLAPVVQIFDEIGINVLNDHKEERPLWSLASIDAAQFEGLPIEFSMTKGLEEIQKQMLGINPHKERPIPTEIQAKLRNYQSDGVNWLERLRFMRLNGILADDMGLGKTLQAIIALTHNKADNPKALSIVVCPTSLVYNWKEEFNKFNPDFRTLPVDGTPAQRKKLLEDIKKFDVVVTSYSLLQKDIEFYQNVDFSYIILDEAQHIKNRGTRNAKSVKNLKGSHRLILTGTPIENSLEELWSLFDFLMPGLLSSYDRFVEKYIRKPQTGVNKNLEVLKRKLSPFILRRMKKDVLDDLPPVTDIVYHCHLSPEQLQLYRAYAESAREELSQLVKKEGFEKVQIHVLSTLTRLKQICCHPAIFAKDKPEIGDSAKYDMLLELLQNLMESKHKTVIFSQYTRMLNIIRQDLQKQGIRFEYLDGSTKNRLDIVNKFNDDANIPIFLVSLKAGGSGLNLVGADTVIHYDMWWNPAVENQATDRVHRIGQKNSVSSYKLVTLGTIEEKILELQDRKRGLVKKIINTDEEAISKLTWEEVLELLQT